MKRHIAYTYLIYPPDYMPWVHRYKKAKTNGWRWFGRLSRNTERVNHITNEIRRQVQVYLEFPMEGW